MRPSILTGLILVLLLLAGCIGQPPLVADATGTGGHADQDATPSSPNPYLQRRDIVPEQAASRFAHAKDLIRKKDWHGALQELHALAKRYPQLSGPCLDLALVYLELGDTERASVWFQRSITSNSDNINAYNEYAIFLRKQGRFTDAEAVYLKALRHWEASADTHFNIGILYDLYLDQPARALHHYHRYQVLTGQSNREVAGWIADLERRLQADTRNARS